MIQFHKATLGKVHMDSTIISPQLVEVKTRKDKPIIKSPKFLGSSILWNSKMFMMDFVYNWLWEYYTPQNSRILYTDTDSMYMSTSEVEGKTK